jgi:hypothetical protein
MPSSALPLGEGDLRRYCGRLVTALVASCALAAPLAALDQVVPEQPSRGVEIQAELAEGLPVSLVHVHLVESTGDPAQDAALKREAAIALGVERGGTFRQLPAQLALNRVRELPGIQSAELRLFQTVPSGQVAVALLVVPVREGAAAAREPRGMLATRGLGDFPTIYEDERAKLVFILNGGAGIFSDTDSWFGGYGEEFNANSPIADDPLGDGTSTWFEAYVEPGIGGVSQLFDHPLYAYGAVSYSMSGTSGHDIYNSGTRGYGDLEKLYAGLIWDWPGRDALVDVSVGRQVYQLRDGFLLSKVPVSTSVGERSALYLGPRLTSKNTVLVRAKASGFGLDAFMIEPSEPDVIETNTRLAGINLQYQLAHAEAAFTYFYLPDSDSVYRLPGGVRLPREGLRTYNPSLSLKQPFGFQGAWVKAEYAYQDHDDFDMSAQAGYVWFGYELQQFGWRPALSYRWSKFSGDDPATETFERFDPLFSGGLGNFLPGIVFSKAYKNANLVTNRATLSVKPNPSLELVLDYFHHRADELNNLGGIGPLQTLASRDIGQEVTLTAYHYIGTHLFVQGIASVGMPGEALDAALGGDADNWYTLQLALYVFF